VFPNAKKDGASSYYMALNCS